MHSHSELNFMFRLINGLLIEMFRAPINLIFGQLLSNYSRHAANLNMKAIRFFYLPFIFELINQTLISTIKKTKSQYKKKIKSIVIFIDATNPGHYSA